MKLNPRRRRSTISSTTGSTARCRGRWPSVFHTEQNEQCFGQPRTVWTDAHMYLPFGSRGQRAGLKSPPSTLPPSYIGSGGPAAQSATTFAHTRSPSPFPTARAAPPHAASVPTRLASLGLGRSLAPVPRPGAPTAESSSVCSVPRRRSRAEARVGVALPTRRAAPPEPAAAVDIQLALVERRGRVP